MCTYRHVSKIGTDYFNPIFFIFSVPIIYKVYLPKILKIYLFLQAFKLFKRNKNRKSTRNKVSPTLVRSPSYSGTTDATSEIDVQSFCPCRDAVPTCTVGIASECYDNTYYNTFNSYDSTNESLQSYNNSICSGRSDSAYDSTRSSPSRSRPVCYATVTYFNVNDSEDSSSIHTEYTLLDFDPDAEDEKAQNMINESLELVSTL